MNTPHTLELSARLHVVIENDVFMRVLDIVLNAECEKDRLAAFQDFFAHDQPDFLDWAKRLRLQTRHLQDCRVSFVNTSDELERALHDADVLVLESLQVGERELSHAPRLQVIQKYGHIVRNIDEAACIRHGVQLLTLRRRANIACAEQAMMMILALAKRLPEINKLTSLKRLREGGFSPAPFDRRHTPSSNWARIPNLDTLYGATLGILGLGEVGRDIAKRANAFEMKVIYSQREQLDRALESGLQVKYVSFEELLEQSDWLVVQLPSGPSTHELLNGEAFRRMKKGLRLINVSRAQCMERGAVLTGLRDGTLGGFALDTLWQEPGDDDDELLGFPNVILTPHTAGSPRQNGLLDFEQMVHQMDVALDLRSR